MASSATCSASVRQDGPIAGLVERGCDSGPRVRGVGEAVCEHDGAPFTRVVIPPSLIAERSILKIGFREHALS